MLLLLQSCRSTLASAERVLRLLLLLMQVAWRCSVWLRLRVLLLLLLLSRTCLAVCLALSCTFSPRPPA